MPDDKAHGVYAPHYYSNFKCIADECRHSCCVCWEIPIDKAALKRYESMESILQTVTECDGEACFRLTEDGRCPHLNKNGLCNIIIKSGEEALCEICKNHPRFFNIVANGRRECGLGIVCEEACRIILESEEPFSLSMISGESIDAPVSAFDALPERAKIIAVIEETGKSFNEKLCALKKKYGIPDIYTKNGWIDRFLELEILDTGWRDTLLKAKKTHKNEAAGFDKYFEKLLTYFVYRHLSISESPDDLRARLGFAILSAEMIKFLFEVEQDQCFDSLSELARRYSSEIEYSEDNTAELIFEFESEI